MQETSGTVATDSSGKTPTIISLSTYNSTPGTNITLTGSGFTGTTSVLFGATSASFTFVSDTSLTVTVPSVSPGNYLISATNSYGTGGANKGTYASSGITYGVTGPLSGGKAITSTGSNAAMTASDSELPLGSTARTIEFWVKTTSTNYGCCFWGYGNHSTPNSNWLVLNSATVLAWSIYGTNGAFPTLSSAINGGTWHHIAVTYSAGASIAALYVDGVSIGNSTSQTVPNITSAGASGLIIGWGTQGVVAGSYAHFAVYPTVLSSGTISSHYSAASESAYEALVLASAPVVYYEMQETSGTLATDSKSQFTVLNNPPTVTGISPSTGPNGGGTSVVITGTSFSGVSGVAFGSNAASSYVVNSTTQITAVTPAGTSTVHTTVTTGSGTSSTSSADQFTYYPPSVTGISPSTGPAGQVVIVSGHYFTSGMTVMFGATNASSQTFNSSAQFTATAPSGTGTVDITVGGSATLSADQFTYSNIPSISSVSPNVGPNAGGTSVLITGSKFTGVVSVYFGSTSAASYIFNSDTSITAVSPAGTTGTVDITVTNATGTNGTSSLDYFTYYPPPTVTGLSLSYGISGTVIVITGTQFTGMSGVKFGSASVTSPTLNSSIQITATAPTNSAGTYDITITTPGGISAISSADQFTYVTTPNCYRTVPNKWNNWNFNY